jgi:hypothetical protein
MSDTATERLTTAQVQDRIETLKVLQKELEDIRLQCLGPASELKQLKTAQETFKEGIALLKGAKLIEELSGPKLDGINGQIDANVQTADTLAQALDNTKNQAAAIHQQLSTKLAAPADLKPTDLEQLFSQIDKIIELREKLVAKVREATPKVKQVDQTAQGIQRTLVNTCKDTLTSAKGRLEAARSDAIYESVHDTVGAVLGFVSLFEPTHIGPMLKGIQVGLQELTNLAQEIQVKVEQHKAATSPLRDTLTGLTPFGVYKSNLMRLKAGFRAAFDGAQLVGLAPAVGPYLAAAVKVLGEMVKGGIDGRIDAAEEVETEMNKELDQVGGTHAPKAEVDRIRAKANAYLHKDWKELLKQMAEEWNPKKSPDTFLAKLASAGAEVAKEAKEGDPGKIATAVLEPVLGKLGEAFMTATGTLPADPPDAIFDFELKMVLTGDVTAINAPFTEAEKLEMFYDIAGQQPGAKPTLAELLKKVRYTHPELPIEPTTNQDVTLDLGPAALPAYDPPVMVGEEKSGTGKRVEYKMKHKFSSTDHLAIAASYLYSDLNFVKPDRSKEKIGSVVHGVEVHLHMEHLSTPGRFLIDTFAVSAPDPATGAVQISIGMTYMFWRVDKYRCELTIDIPPGPAYKVTNDMRKKL